MFKYRLVSFIVLLSLFGAMIFWNSLWSIALFACLALPLAYGAVYEYLAMMEKIGYKTYKKQLAVIALIIMALTILFGTSNYFICLFLLAGLIAWFIMLFNFGNKEVLEKVVISGSAFLLVIIPLFFIAKLFIPINLTDFLFSYYVVDSSQLIVPLEFGELVYNGKMMVLYLILTTKSGDTGAYCVGMLANKINGGKNHPIVPNISPKKSWEGTIGGLLTSITVSILLLHIANVLGEHSFMPENNLYRYIIAVIFGIVLFFSGFFGDLVESNLKRISGVKDSGAIIPGMGGVLDVVDSLLVAVPVFVITKHILWLVFYYGQVLEKI